MNLMFVAEMKIGGNDTEWSVFVHAEYVHIHIGIKGLCLTVH